MPTRGLPLFCHGSGMKKEEILDHYDGVAAQYDGLYSKPDILAVDRELIGLIEAKLKPDDWILDLGCGTGFFLDHVQWPPGSYLGVEPSRGMCDQFRFKHPDHPLSNSYLTKDIVDDFGPSLFLGLYGVGDYLGPEDIDLIRASDYFMMFSVPGKLNPINPLARFTRGQLALCRKNPDHFSGNRMVIDNAYLLVSNRL